MTAPTVGGSERDDLIGIGHHFEGTASMAFLAASSLLGTLGTFILFGLIEFIVGGGWFGTVLAIEGEFVLEHFDLCLQMLDTQYNLRSCFRIVTTKFYRFLFCHRIILYSIKP